MSRANITTASRPITTKHHWGGVAALGFEPEWIRTLVSIATDSSNRVIMEKNLVATLASSFLMGSSSFLQGQPSSIDGDRNLIRSDHILWSAVYIFPFGPLRSVEIFCKILFV